MRISDWSSDVCSSDLLDKLRAEPAIGVEFMEVVRRKAAHFHERDGERVTERHLDRGGGGGRQRIGARFLHVGHQDADVGRWGDRTVRARRHAQQGAGEALEIWDDREIGRGWWRERVMRYG